MKPKMIKPFRHIALLLPLILTGQMGSAQNDNTKKTTEDITADVVSAIADDTPVQGPEAAPAKPVYWKKGIQTTLAFSQTSLTNWSAGGDGNFTLNAFIDATADYLRNKWLWDNRMQMGYGFTYSMNGNETYRYKKSDDRLQLDSEVGRLLTERLYLSGLMTFKTQFTDGLPYSGDNNRISSFLAPGYLNLGLGVDWKALTFLSLYLSPVTGNFVIVALNDSTIRKNYGNSVDQAVRAQLGAQMKMDIKYTYQTFSFNTSLVLFSDYLHNFGNIQVNWDLSATVKLWKVLSISLRTSLIYDDNIAIADKDGNKCPRVQFKEIGGIGIVYTIGNYTKR